MKLPTRGCLYDTAGRVLWAWEHNDPTTDFDALPPLVTDPQTGEQKSLARPDHAVLDLDTITVPGDMEDLYRDLSAVRVERTTDGACCLKQEITDSAGNGLRVDHPLMTRINARRLLNKQSPLSSTPDRITVATVERRSA